jgi:hypothetical protein
MAKGDKYLNLIERVFFKAYKEGASEVLFTADDVILAASELGIEGASNPADVRYTFRHRKELPDSIKRMAPPGTNWVIRPAGRSRYKFEATKALTSIHASAGLIVTDVPDATPGVISLYALSDEQALLAKIRYNRLLDIFTRVACYPLQSHLRTTVKKLGRAQIETDEVYIGIDRRGAHYVFPVQAKTRKERLGTIQIEQDFAMCSEKFPRLICQPIAAQFLDEDRIALFMFEQSSSGVVISLERHYRLVPSDEFRPDELAIYRDRAFGDEQ